MKPTELFMPSRPPCSCGDSRLGCPAERSEARLP